MNPIVKSYIEKNIELLETDSKRFFAKAASRLSSLQFESLIHILTSSHIDFSSDRELFILNKFPFLLPSFDDGMPLQQAIRQHLIGRFTDTFFGWSVEELENFIYKNKQLWEHDIDLINQSGQIIVRTIFND